MAKKKTSRSRAKPAIPTLRQVNWLLPQPMWERFVSVHALALKELTNVPESANDFALGVLSIGMGALTKEISSRKIIVEPPRIIVP